jgi:polyhydroxyalkanoate synthesis regulator phasin
MNVTDYEQMHGEPLEQIVPALAERVDTLEERVAELEAKLRRLLSDEWRGPERS